MANRFPTFEEWVHDCFTQKQDDAVEQSSVTEAISEHQGPQLLPLTDLVTTQYLVRLFESPGFIADRYSRPQIADGIWYIFGARSDMIFNVIYSEIPIDLQIRAYRSVLTLYTDFLDGVCGIDVDNPDSDPRTGGGVDSAVYMIWDMDHLIIPLQSPSEHPHLVEPSIYILENVLLRCRTTTCILSALHGIGHACQCDAMRGDPEDRVIATRLRAAVDRLLKTREIPTWLTEYAHAAKAGEVL